MSVLDSVLQYKAQKEAREQADLQSIPTAISTIAAFQQQARENQYKSLALQADLAPKGYIIGQDASGRPTIVANPNFSAPVTAKDRSTIGLNEAKTAESKAKASLLDTFTKGGSGDAGGMTLTGGTIGGLTFENTPAKLKIQEQEAAAKLKVPTAKMQEDLNNAKAQLGMIQNLKEEAKSVPSGWNGIGAWLANVVTRGADVKIGDKSITGNSLENAKVYTDKKPAIAVSVYRAATGDTRLSDADAKARALPLLWDPNEAENIKARKFDDMEKIFKARISLIEQGRYTTNKEGDFITPFESVMAEAKKLGDSSDSGGIKTFKTTADAEKAGLKAGERVKIGNKVYEWRDS